MNSVLVTIAPAIDALTSVYLAGAQRSQSDDEFGQVAERGVEQSTDGVTGLRRNRFGRMAEQRRQRNDRQYGQHEQQGRRIRGGPLRGEERGHEYEQPEETVMTDLVE